jgi:hypothetical protein
MIAIVLSVLFKRRNLLVDLATISRGNNKIVAGIEAIKLKNGKYPYAPWAVEPCPSEIKMIAVKTVKIKKLKIQFLLS